MPTVLGTSRQRLNAHVQQRIEGWRTGSRGSQLFVLFLLLALAGLTLLLARFTTDLVPLTVWFLWLLVGMMTLRFGPLLVLCAVVMVCSTYAAQMVGLDGQRVVMSLLTLAVASILVVFQSSRQRSGLPVALSEAVLTQLRDRLQAQGVMPELPHGWVAESATLTAHGTSYAGDFFLAEVADGRHLEMVLVDVCGKGMSVGPQALQFSGALGGLLGVMPPADLMRAANTFLIRQNAEESFATAVHLLIDLQSGTYAITSAGHPPALHWRRNPGGWFVDNARGMALGVIDDVDHEPSWGQIAPGEALMFYTDGVVEKRDADLDVGIEWLRQTAMLAVDSHGFPGLPRRILRKVRGGNDDRAVLVLRRLEN